MNDHIAKPIDVQQLFISLNKWIRPGSTQATPLPECDQAPDDAPLPELPGVQLERALQRLGGNTDLLRKLLLRFSETQSGAAEAISSARTAGDRETATRTAHTLKGLAGNIGAHALADIAARIEAGIHHGQDIAGLLAELATALDQLIGAIEHAGLGVEAAKARNTAEPLGQSAPLNADEIAELRDGLARLEKLLLDDDGEAGKCLDALSGSLARIAKPAQIEKLQSLIGQYRFDDALSTLAAVRNDCPPLSTPAPLKQNPV